MAQEEIAGAPLRTAVLPVAGLGTRFLPATKAQPKEMLPIVDKPLVQYAVEEVAASGIPMVIFVTGRGKEAIENHFDVSFELEHQLAGRGKEELRSLVRAVAGLAKVCYVRQQQARGLGDAILTARGLVGDEPFAVVLSDDVIEAPVPCLRQMMKVYAHYGRSVVAIQRVSHRQVSNYGIVQGVPESRHHWDGRVFRIQNMVEKPSPGKAPSNLAIIGRYILTPGVFHQLATTQPGAGGEVQLTDAMRHLLEREPIYGCVFEGQRYDAGDKLGFLKATVELALKRPDLGSDFRKYLRSLLLSRSGPRSPSGNRP